MFPLLSLNNELLAGVCQRVSQRERGRLELVNRRLCAVTKSHGSIYRRELDVQLKYFPPWPFISEYTICGFPLVDVADARAVVHAMVARYRVSRLRIGARDYRPLRRRRGPCWHPAWRPLFDVAMELSMNPRVRPLRAVILEGGVEQFWRDEEVNPVFDVAYLLRHHATTIDYLALTLCDSTVDGADRQLWAAAAGCVNVRQLVVTVARSSYGTSAAVACMGQYNRLERLTVSTEHQRFVLTGSRLFESLPVPTHLEELCVTRVEGCLPAGFGARADVLASLRVLRLDDCWAVQVAGFVGQLSDYCPRLELLVIGDWCLDIDWPCLEWLVRRYFAPTTAHELRVEVVVCVPRDNEWPAACADLVSSWRDDVTGLRIACSDAILCASLNLASVWQEDVDSQCRPRSVLPVVFELECGEGGSRRRLVMELDGGRDESHESYESDESDESDEPDEYYFRYESNESDEPDESNESNESDESDESDEPDESYFRYESNDSFECY